MQINLIINTTINPSSIIIENQLQTQIFMLVHSYTNDNYRLALNEQAVGPKTSLLIVIFFNVSSSPFRALTSYSVL
jgi:hypothetical protein